MPLVDCTRNGVENPRRFTAMQTLHFSHCDVNLFTSQTLTVALRLSSNHLPCRLTLANVLRLSIALYSESIVVFARGDKLRVNYKMRYIITYQ